MSRFLVVAALLVALAAPAAAAAPSVAPYRGLGAWVDLYDPGAWANPEASVAALSREGARTLFLETSSYRRQNDVERPALVARFVDAAHARGLRIVAWYLPSFRDVARDRRRSLAAVRFRTPAGGAFDSFALDIEASLVTPPSLRTARLLDLSARLRAAVGPAYALGGIIPSPRGMELLPHYWPGFPYAELARSFDVFLPMVYFSYRTRGFGDARDYTVRSVAIIRRATGDPNVAIDLIGGVASSARLPQVRGFAAAARGCNAIGTSLYDAAGMTEPFWDALRRPGAAAWCG